MDAERDRWSVFPPILELRLCFVVAVVGVMVLVGYGGA